MSVFGSQRALNMAPAMGSRHDLTGGSQFYARSELVPGAGNGLDYLDGYTFAATSRSAGGAAGVGLGGAGGGMR